MCKVAACSGGLGDLIFAIPVMRELGITKLFVKEAYYYQPYGSLYTSIKRLLEYEGFEALPTSGAYEAMKYEPGLVFDYDIDSFRKMPMRGRVWIPTNMRRYFGLEKKEYKPWLKMPVSDEGYTIIHLTGRWRTGSRVDWKKILEGLRKKNETIYFTGFQYEWLDFTTKYGPVEWKPVEDMYELCQVVSKCKQVYCNQSAILAICQGLGKNYWLERNPGKTNCLTFSQNEHLLNP